MNKSSRILILVPNLPGGVATYYKTLQLEKYRNITYFIVNSPKPQPRLATLWRLFINYWIFFYKIIRHRYELIHLNPSLGKRSFYREAVFIIIALLLNKKTLVLFNGWLDTFELEIKKSKFKSFLFRISYAKVNKYIVLSRLFKNKLHYLGVPMKTEFFITTTVADSRYIQEIDLERKLIASKEKMIFLFLSRITKEKGVYIAIDAYKKFIKDHPEKNSCLNIAGDGPELLSVKKYVTKEKIPNVNFLNYVSDDRKNKVLQESHIMILPSYSEGLPNSILEGMLYGMPVISRITGGIPDIIHQGVNGYLSESFEPSIFTDFMNLLVTDKELYRKMALTNHHIALEKYTCEKVREKMFEIYESC